MHAATAIVIAVLIGIIATPPALHAGDGFGDAGQPGEYLYYGTSVRSMAMGRTYVGLADDAAALFHNPAGLMNVSRLWDGYLMHFKPLYGTRYNAFAVTYAGPDTLLTGYRGFLFGPNSAWGIGGVYLSSDDYQYRTDNDIYEGDFGLYQQALFASFARRQVISIGGGDFAMKVDAGAGLKITRQGFSGLRTYESDYGTGLDIGAQLQFIHPWPFSSYLPLRVLLPLRLGASVQNFLFRPQAGFGGKSDEFPTIYRLGFSYAFVVSPLTKVLVAGDAAKQDWNCRSWGYHLGTEFMREFKKDSAAVFLRLGGYYQSRQWRPTVGIGFAFDITDKLSVEVDFAHEFHTALHEDVDQRFALKLAYGISRDAGMYMRFADQSTDNPRESYYRALEALTCYPYRNTNVWTADGQLEPVGRAAELLGDRLDTVRQERYAQFIGRIYYARELVNSARALLRVGDYDGAQAKGRKAIDIFAKIKNELDKESRLLFAEAYLIIAETDSSRRITAADSAITKFSKDSTDVGGKYLIGRCYLLKGEWSEALARFNSVLTQTGEHVSDTCKLSIIGKAMCLAALGKHKRYTSDYIVAFVGKMDSTLNGYVAGKLSPTYPPYPAFPDGNLADDALFWKAQCYEKLGPMKYAAENNLALMDICRLYPVLDRCKNTDKQEVSRPGSGGQTIEEQ